MNDDSTPTVNPEDEQLDKTHAAMTRATRRRQQNSSIVTLLVAMAAVMVCASAVLSAWNLTEIQKLNRDAAEIRRINLLGTECIVEQLSEHRHLTALAHRAAATDHGYTYPIAPENEPPNVPGILENVCKTFLATTTSTNPVRR